MAIHEDVPGIEVAVRCNEQPLREFEDPHGHDNDGMALCPSAVKYIECVDDAEFDINIRIDSTYLWGYRDHILVATTYVDGKYVRGLVIRQKDTDYGAKATYIVKGRHVCSSRSGRWSRQNFRFAAVKTIDDARKERVEKDIKTAKGLGTISIKFNRAIDHGLSFHYGKAVSHGTSYGDKEAIGAPQCIDARNIEEDNGPILVMNFMYRSKDALKRELIIPRSPSPDFEQLTPAERDRLARERLNQLREQNIKNENRKPLVKREFGEILDLTGDGPAPRPTKKSRLQDGREVDVIDLTDD
ncbi:hypothetical protein ONZ43_g3218 [Nemania bipapillata]|uniref:Uncharacterized protein n=1 Tax=Nemania bipapillata TaxID=110536 RepID=A0ACC2IXU2_9PEZI|nr:hypothetical protein ONZ43_g3218 [Nemania bipapillata]